MCRLFCSDPACGVSPAEELTPEHLKLLRDAFTCAGAEAQIKENIPNGMRRSNRGKKSEEREMNLGEFTDVLRSVIGPDIEDTWVERFFSEVTTNQEMYLSK